MISAVLDHIWQSSLFGLSAAAVTVLLRRNRAAVRFALWFAASVKFLIPFAALSALGGILSDAFPELAPPPLLALQPVAARMADPARLIAGSQAISWAPSLLFLWGIGAMLVVGVRLARGRTLADALRQSREAGIAAPLPVRTIRAPLEPGLVGILRPAILFPAGLIERLSDAERAAILAHELAHWERRDNLTAAIHRVVEILFWFHPLVWLIGSRLIAERESACDEVVLAEGHDAQTYASAILAVCRFCLPLPLACAAGGADLKARLTHIMLEPGRSLGAGGRFILSVFILLNLALPLAAGFTVMPVMVAIQSQVAAAQVRAVQALGVGVTSMAEQMGVRTHRVHFKHRVPHSTIEATGGAHSRNANTGSLLQARDAALQPPPVQIVDVTLVAPEASPTPSPKPILVTNALYPAGDSDPDAVTCRLPQHLPGSRLSGPKVCKVNRLWAELRAEHAVISPDGREVDVPSDGARRRAMNAAGCNTNRQGGGATASVVGLPQSFCF